MMMRMVLGVFLGLLPLVLVAADDADEMDWEEVDCVVAGERSSQEQRHFHYLRDAIGADVALVGMQEAFAMEIDVARVPEDPQALEVAEGLRGAGGLQENEPVAAGGVRAVPQAPGEERLLMFEEEDLGLLEDTQLEARREALRERLQVLEALEARYDRLRFELYATPDELERVVPEVDAPSEDGFRARTQGMHHPLSPFLDVPPVFGGMDAVGSGW